MHEQRTADLLVRPGRPGRAATVRVLLEPVVDRRGRLTAVSAAFASRTRPPRLVEAAPEPPRPAARARPGTGKASAGNDAAGPLAGTLRELTARLERLRHQQQAQAVVDRAKGLLSARLGCSIETALDRLGATARERDASLLEVAADVVGAALPIGDGLRADDDCFRPETYLGSPAVRAGQEPPVRPASVDERVARVEELLGAAEDGDGVASILWSAGLRATGAHAVVLGVLEPDGAVRLAGSYGLPADLVAAWRRTPGSLNVPYLRAVATDRPLWIGREEAAARGYQLLGEGEFRACLPLHQGSWTFGVASVLWPRATTLDEDSRAHVTALAEAAGRRLSDLLRAAPHEPTARPLSDVLRAAPHESAASPAAHWAATILGALPPCWALLRPLRDPDGEVVDWRFEICSPGTRDVAGRAPDEMTGRRLRELYPHVLTTGIAEVYRAAMQAGTSAGWGPAEFDIETASGPVTVTMSGRASKFGDGILIHWRREENDLLDRRLLLLERVTGSGWAEWDLTGGEAVWSEAVFELLRRDPRRGPVRLGALHRYVTGEDEAPMTEAVRQLTRLRRPVDVTVRLRRQGTVTPVRFAARPVLDENGRVTAVRAVFQRPSPD
jgi:hypothetical protein